MHSPGTVGKPSKCRQASKQVLFMTKRTHGCFNYQPNMYFPRAYISYSCIGKLSKPSTVALNNNIPSTAPMSYFTTDLRVIQPTGITLTTSLAA